MLTIQIAQILHGMFHHIPELDYCLIGQDGCILSGHASQIGRYHAAAHKAILSSQGPVTYPVDKDNAQRHQTIHVLRYQERVVGGVVVTGNSSDISVTASVFAVALETALSSLIPKCKREDSEDSEKTFHSKLLGKHTSSSAELLELAERFHYRANVVRIPVLIALQEGEIGEEICRNIERDAMHDPQDIRIQIDPQRILVFKYIGDAFAQAIGGYKSVLFEYLAHLNRMELLMGLPHKFYIGSMQNRLDFYKWSFQHVSWLESNTDPAKGNAFFFYEYGLEYMESCVYFTEYQHIFHAYEGLFEDTDREQFVHTVSALFENNMNLAKTAAAMYVHRNTLIFRLNKIKDILNIDPINSNSGRQFLHLLLHYYHLLRQNT